MVCIVSAHPVCVSAHPASGAHASSAHSSIEVGHFSPPMVIPRFVVVPGHSSQPAQPAPSEAAWDANVAALHAQWMSTVMVPYLREQRRKDIAKELMPTLAPLVAPEHLAEVLDVVSARIVAEDERP